MTEVCDFLHSEKYWYIFCVDNNRRAVWMSGGLSMRYDERMLCSEVAVIV